MDFDLSPELRMWRDAVHNFVAKEIKPHAAEYNAREEIMWPALQKGGQQLGLLGMTVPEEYGGSALGALGMAIAIEELGWGDGGTALVVAAHNGLGCAPIVMFGNEAQKRRFLPRVVAGEPGQLAALALTEPNAGSDLKGIQTRAELEGDTWVISGSKMWITNAGEADYIVTLVRTSPERSSHSLSLIVVPTNVDGLHVGPPEKKMGLGTTHSHAITYDHVRVPRENLLGEVGHGMYQTLQVLDGGRISIGALALGIAQAAFEEAVAYAKQRMTFGKPLAARQAIQFMLADMATEIHAARLMVYHAAWLKQQGRPFSHAAAMAKLFATEMAERVTRNAIQIHGGYGYSREFPVERMYRDARLMTIGEGTSEIQRIVIARRVLSSMASLF
ncbi:MAG: acyl-CoA dehydrogenase [Chloroflexi bacterium]|nr:acyl-CoA dehydrogenase [Chloroflexota bacterium]